MSAGHASVEVGDMSDSVRDELRRLISSPKVNFNNGFADLPLDAIIGHASDGKNIDIEFGAVEKRSGSKVLDNPSQSRMWQIQFEETISGTSLHFGITWQGTLIAFCDEFPEVPLVVNKTGFTKFVYTDVDPNKINASYEVKFDRGTRFWHIPGSNSFIIVNDYGDYFVVRKNGCIQFLSDTNVYHMYNTVGRTFKLRYQEVETAGVYVDAVFNRQTDPHPFFMVQADPDKYASLKGNVRVLPVDNDGRFGAMSDFKTVYEYDSKYIGMIEMRSMRDGGIYKVHDLLHLPTSVPGRITLFGRRLQTWPVVNVDNWIESSFSAHYTLSPTFTPSLTMSQRRACFGLSVGSGDESEFRLFMWFDKRFYKAGEDPLEADTQESTYVNNIAPKGVFIQAEKLHMGLPIPAGMATFSGIAASAFEEDVQKSHAAINANQISGLTRIYRATVADDTGFDTLGFGNLVVAEWDSDNPDHDGFEFRGRYNVWSWDDSDPYYVWLIGEPRGDISYTPGKIKLSKVGNDRSISGKIPLYIKKATMDDQPVEYYIYEDHKDEPNATFITAKDNRTNGMLYELEFPDWLPSFIINNIDVSEPREKNPTYIFQTGGGNYFNNFPDRMFVAMFSGLIWIDEIDGKPAEFSENAWRYTIDFSSDDGFVLLKNLGFDNWEAKESFSLLPEPDVIEDISLNNGEIISPLTEYELAVRKGEYLDWLLFGHRFAVWNNSEVLGISQKAFIRTADDTKHVTQVSPLYGWPDNRDDKTFDGTKVGKVPGQIDPSVDIVCGYLPVMALDYTSLRRFAYTATPIQSTLENPVDFTVNNGRIYAASGTRLLIGSNSETMLFEFEIDLKHEITAVKSIFEGVVVFGKHNMYYINASGQKKEIANKLTLRSLNAVKVKELNSTIYGITEANDIFQLVTTFPESGEPFITCNNLSGAIPEKRWDDNADFTFCGDTLFISSGDTVWGYSNGAWRKQRQFDGKRIYYISSYRNRLVISFHDDNIFPGRVGFERPSALWS